MARLIDTASSLDEIKRKHPAAFAVSRGQRALFGLLIAAMVGLFIFGFYWLEFSFTRFVRGLGQIGWFFGLMMPPDPGTHLWLFVHALGETLAIAFLGTALAAILAFPFGFLAAHNILPSSIPRFLTRRSLDVIRGVDTLIWALIWISVVGLGPFAGVLAIASADFAAFGKLFSEAIEAAEQKSIEGIRACGGTRAQEIRFGLIPQILPVIASQVLYYFESNTRSATIIGIVGAGGIGLHLSEQIRTLEWQQVSFIILLVLITVAAIDFLSSRLRNAIIGARPV